jgi:hypothetical protein
MSVEASSPAAATALQSLSVVGCGEPLCAADCSAYALACAVYGASQGAFYPPGGAAALARALCGTIRSAGGVVYDDVLVQEALLEEITGTNTVRATGVSVTSATARVHADMDAPEEAAPGITFTATKSVISGIGAIATFTKLIPAEAVSRATHEVLATLRESRPFVRVVYWLRGDAVALAGLTGVDYYQVGTQPVLEKSEAVVSPAEAASNGQPALQSSDSASKGTGSKIEERNELLRDKFASDYAHVWCPSCKDPTWSERYAVDA